MEKSNSNLNTSNLSEAKKSLLEKWKKGKQVINEINKRKKYNMIPLSFAQQRIWFLEQLIENTSVYNIPGAVYLEGDLDIDAINKTISKIIERHEILRTQFIVVDNKPLQQIIEPQNTKIRFIDLSNIDKEKREEEAFKFMDKEAKTPIKLDKAPLIRTMLIRLDERKYIFFISMHHIISDGWSLGIFNKELIKLYDAYTCGKDVKLKDLTIQYGDFSEWQREKLEKGEFDKQILFWKKQLGDLKNNNISLPYDYKKPATPSYIGKRYYFEIPEKIFKKVNDLAIENGATLYMALLSALEILVFRYSGQSDLTVGCPIANRNHNQIEDLIGFFVNTIVIRSNINGDSNFIDVLNKIKDSSLQAYMNQDMPFERVVEAINPERNMSGTSPLYQIGFVLQNTPTKKNKPNNLTLTPINLFNGMTPYELLLSLFQDEGKLIGYFEYSADLFKESKIKRMYQHFITILQSIVSNPLKSVKTLKMIPDCELKDIFEFGRKKENYSSNICIHEKFNKIVEQYHDKVAITFQGKSLMYGELNRYANILAFKLIEDNVSKESLIGVYMEPSIEMIVSIIAILKVGAAYVPISTLYPKDRIKYIAQDSNIEMMISQSYLTDKLSCIDKKILTVDMDELERNHEDVPNPKNICDESNLAYIIYTSGSTGKPKGVLVEHRNVIRLFEATNNWFQFNEDDVWTLFHSHAFDFSVWEIWGALLKGGRLVIVPYLISRSPESFYNLLSDEGVTVLNQTPSAFKQLIQVDQRMELIKLKKLRYIIFGGEALEFSSLKPWFDRHGDKSPKLINMYGITETTVHVSYKPIHKSDITKDGSSIGVPIPDLSIYLLDQNGEIVPIGIPGEIYVGGAGVTRGYLNRDELTKEKFISDPFSNSTDSKVYRSGDLAKFTENGELEYLGRIDHQVKIRGFRLEIGEIEAILKQHDSVMDAVVVIKPDAIGSKQLLAYVIEKKHEDEEDKKNMRPEILKQWKQVFKQVYDGKKYIDNPKFNIIGWNSLYDGKPIPKDQMKEWVDETVKQILKEKPTNMIEIGCGTGLLLFRLIDECKSYLGTDMSETSINNLKKYTANINNVHLICQSADNNKGIPINYFDTAVINSVVQYFPSVEYLVEVIKNTCNSLKYGGSIFIGDVRSLPLLKTFYYSVEKYQNNKLPLYEIEKRVTQRISNEHELILDPRLFYALKLEIPRITGVEVRIKRGYYHNELSRFRYDVVLRLDNKEMRVDKYSVDWKDGLTIEDVKKLLEDNKYDVITINRVPNARLKDYFENLKNNSVDPMSFFELEQNFNYDVKVLWAGVLNDDKYNVIFTNKKLIEYNRVTNQDLHIDGLNKCWTTYANTPNQRSSLFKLNLKLRNYLSEKLPNYMVPTACLTVNKFPLTPNGKINIEALPLPEGERPELKNSFKKPTTKLEKQLAEIWSSVLGIPDIGVNDSFFELGGHSLLATQLIFKLREILNIEIPLKVLFEIPTISWMALKIEALRKGEELKFNSSLNLRDDAIFDYKIRKVEDDKINVFSAKKILLTGATGFLGAYLLREIAERTSAEIYCIVRGKDENEALSRLKQNLNYYNVWNDKYLEKIKIVNGDLEKPLLNLSENKFNDLCNEIEIIYHNGSKVNFVSPYIENKAANVLGTKEIIKIANTGIKKELHYISTTHVYSYLDVDNNVLYEDKRPNYPEALTLGYTQSKWVAETMIAKAASEGLPAYIYRLGRIWGDSIQGKCHTNDFLWLIIMASIKVGVIPNIDMNVNVMPVDFVSSAVIELSNHHVKYGTSYNIINPSEIRWDEIIYCLETIGYKMERVSLDLWQSKIIEAGSYTDDVTIRSLIPLLDSEWKKGIDIKIKVQYKNMLNGLRNSNIKCPAIEINIIKKYIDYFIKIGILNKPEHDG